MLIDNLKNILREHLVISLHVHVLSVDVQLNETAPLSNIIQQASEKNFVQGIEGILHLQKGDKHILAKDADGKSIKFICVYCTLGLN